MSYVLSLLGGIGNDSISWPSFLCSPERNSAVINLIDYVR